MGSTGWRAALGLAVLSAALVASAGGHAAGVSRDAPGSTPFDLIIEHGRVITDARAEALFLGGLPYNLFLLRNAAKRAMTFESPRKLAWNDRIAIHRIAVTSAIERLGRV